jgi:radical SAM protein with 4Fe4S-binding SPASM domain
MTCASREERFALVEGNVLHDRTSGRKLVLDDTAMRFFAVFQEYGHDPAASDRIAAEFDLPIARARDDYERFCNTVDQGQSCRGSILPGRLHAVLEPTAACNGGCGHCYHTDHRERWTPTQREKAIEMLAASGIRSVSITGGEVFSPHYLEEFFTLAARLTEQGIAIGSVSTNATFLTEMVRDRVLATLPRSTVFRISLDALRGQLLDRIRPGYRRLADPYQPIRDLDTVGQPLVFTTNVSVQPPADIVEIANYLRTYGHIDAWNVRLHVPVHWAAADRPRPKQLRMLSMRPEPTAPLSVYEALLAEHARYPFIFDLRLGNYLTTSLLRHPHALTALTDDHPCREDKALLTVKATGEVTQCPILSELRRDLVSGSLDDDAFSLDESYASALPLANLSIAATPCAACRLRPVCGGGCRLYALAYGEGLTGCDLPARALLNWIEQDPSGLLCRHWPAYHARFISLLDGARSNGGS